jgi:hypothetical protein
VLWFFFLLFFLSWPGIHLQQSSSSSSPLLLITLPLICFSVWGHKAITKTKPNQPHYHHHNKIRR